MPAKDIVSLSERESLIRETPLFRELNVTEISQLAGIMQEVSVMPGEAVVKEGELIDSVYIIASGTLEVTKQVDYEGKTGSTFLAIINPGESIGLRDAGLFAKTGRRTATVTAQSASVLLKINIKDFDDFLDRHPQTLQSLRSSTDLMLRMQFIKESNPFVHLSNQHIAWLATSVKTIEVKEGEILFKQNDPVDNCYMILDGTVEITTQEKKGSSKVVSTLTSGQLFGEQAFFKNAKRATTARAVTACHLMVLDHDTLEELKEETQDTSPTLFTQSSAYNRPVRLENIIHHHRTLGDGEVITTLKDPTRNQYLQLNDENWYLWQLLNGQMTIQEITQQFSKHYNRFDPQTVMNTINMFIDNGFAKADVMQSDTSVANKNKASKTLTDRFQWMYSLKNPDSKFTKLYKYFGFLFFPIPILIFITAIIIAGMIIYPRLVDDTFQAIHQKTNIYLTLIWIVFLCVTIRLINPLAKALTVKYFGHSVPHFAIGLRFFLPIAFVDTSDLWASSRLQRCMTQASGIIATLLIASLLTLFVYFYPTSVFAFLASMCALVLYFLTLRSLDPLLDSDGYQALVNALDAPNLREFSLNGLTQRTSNLNINRSVRRYKHRTIYFIYYFFYVLLNFIFIYIIQVQLRAFGLEMLWNNGLIYIALFAGLFIELLIELSHLKKFQQILASE